MPAHSPLEESFEAFPASSVIQFGGDASAIPTPKRKEATASGFANWVYDISGARVSFERDGKRIERLREAKFLHEDIELFALWHNREFPGSISSRDWVLGFAASHAETSPARVFKASRLRVGGEPLRCVPDVVLRNCSTSEVIVIERKITWVPLNMIPTYGWANLQAQLWCYGWIDDWQDAPEVYLLGQIWTREGVGGRAKRLAWVYPRWRRSDSMFHQQWSKMFERYGGSIA
jgi:hypothetical protein